MNTTGEPAKQQQQQYPEGHFVGIWMAISIILFGAVGVPLSIATGNPGFIGVGPGIGLAFGLIIGQSVERKKAAEGRIRPLTPAEIKTRKRALWMGVALLVLGVLAGAWFMLAR